MKGHGVRGLIVFDLDGTLVDSRLDLAESTNEMLASYDAAPLPIDDVAAMVGDGARALVERALTASRLNPHEPEALDRFLAVYDRRLLNHTRPYDGISDIVRRLEPRARMAVLTNKPEAPTKRLLEAFGWTETFGLVVGGDSSFPRKPHPAGLQHLMSAAGTGRESTLLVGDSMIDVETAHRAGVHLCLAMYGFGQLRGELTLTGKELWADDPAEVGKAVDTFLEQLSAS